MNRIARIIYWVLVVLVLVYGTIYLIWGDKDAAQGSSISLIASYILFGLALGITVIASIGNLIQHPKSSLRSLIGVAVIALIGIIGFTISKGEVTDTYINFGIKTANSSKLVDVGLYMSYALSAISLIGILIAEVSGVSKN